VLAHPALGRACAPLIEKAREHFRHAHAIMDRQPRASVKAPRIMAEAYAPMLDKLQQRGFAAPRERVRLDRLHLIAAVLRYGIV
jgi:phytoene synthase